MLQSARVTRVCAVPAGTAQTRVSDNEVGISLGPLSCKKTFFHVKEFCSGVDASDMSDDCRRIVDAPHQGETASAPATMDTSSSSASRAPLAP